MTLFWQRFSLQKYCSRIDFMENIIEFSHPEDPLPFADSFGDDLDAEVFDQCILSVHADNSFTIPAQSEVVVVGRLSSVPVKFMDWSRLSLIFLTVTQFLERQSS